MKSSGKKRKILDLRFVRVKFGDLKVALNYLEKVHFMFSFDIKNRYH